MRAYASILLCPFAVCAAGNDYYQCATDGGTVYSVVPCARGQGERRVAAAAPPVNVRLAGGRGGVVRLEKQGAHFFTTVVINGRPVRAIVDTGASLVALGPATAARLGIDLRQGRRTMFSTANGQAPGVVLPLSSVELGDNRFEAVLAGVGDKEMGPGFDVLLGMSVLHHFEMTMDGSSLTLRPR